MELILNNWELVVTIIMFAAAILLKGKQRAWFEWANETLDLAFDNAEKKGLLEGIGGADKLQHYLNIWRQAYRERFGTDPTEQAITYAVNRAASLAEKEKTIAKIGELANPKV